MKLSESSYDKDRDLTPKIADRVVCWFIKALVIGISIIIVLRLLW